MMGITLLQILLLAWGSHAHAKSCATDVLRKATKKTKVITYQQKEYLVDPHLRAVPVSHGGSVDSWKIVNRENELLSHAKDNSKWVEDPSYFDAKEVIFPDGSKAIELSEEGATSRLVRLQKEPKKFIAKKIPENPGLDISHTVSVTPEADALVYNAYLDPGTPRVQVILERDRSQIVKNVYDSQGKIVPPNKVTFIKKDGKETAIYFDKYMNSDVSIEHYRARPSLPQKFEVFDMKKSRLEFHDSYVDVRMGAHESFEFYAKDFLDLVNAPEIKQLEWEILQEAKRNLKLKKGNTFRLSHPDHRDAVYQVMTKRIDDRFGQEILPDTPYKKRAGQIRDEDGNLRDVIRARASVCRNQAVIGHLMLARLGIPSEVALAPSINHAFVKVEGKALDFQNSTGKGVWGYQKYLYHWDNPQEVIDDTRKYTSQFITIEAIP